MLSIQIFLHRLRTTTCSASSSPDVVFQEETVAIRAQVGHCNSSLSSSWRNGAPQAVRASDHDFLHNAQLSCLILRNLESFLFCSGPSLFRSASKRPDRLADMVGEISEDVSGGVLARILDFRFQIQQLAVADDPGTRFNTAAFASELGLVHPGGPKICRQHFRVGHHSTSV